MAEADERAEFGAVLGMFRPGAGRLVVAGLAGLVLWAIAGRMAWSLWYYPAVVRSRNWALLALIPFAIGLGAFIYLRRLAAAQTLVCRDGLVRRGRGAPEICRWEDIERIEDNWFQDYVPLHLPVKIPMKKSRMLVVVRKDGATLAWDGDDIRQMEAFGMLLSREARSRGIPWEAA